MSVAMITLTECQCRFLTLSTFPHDIRPPMSFLSNGEIQLTASAKLLNNLTDHFY